MKFRLHSLFAVLALLGVAQPLSAQQVGLPSPRLQTTMPMGGQVGTTFPVSITGQFLDGDIQLLFSNPHITAVPKLDDAGKRVPDQYVVTIGAEAEPGIYEARAMSRLGISSFRAFSVGTLPEITRTQPNTKLATALVIQPNSVCNAQTTGKEVDYYKFTVDKKTRVLVECAATGIDSRLKPVLVVSDEQGRDLISDRRNGFVDVTLPAAGTYVIKVHDLTYQGGPDTFYRLVLRTLSETEALTKHPRTSMVNSISVPASIALQPTMHETEPNNRPNAAEKITLPCDIAGSFYPDADVDTFEFTANEGEVWWLEVVSERLGLPTNPFVLVQQIDKQGESENAVDYLELNDVASPVKLSSNGYTYDGPYYDVGTSDAMGSLQIKKTGTYRLQLRDLYGGTRRDPMCTYRLIIRKAEPDFSLASWALHMELRNGDRNVRTKPIALRHGGAMIFEVITVRKDGFNGPIEIYVDDLPAGMSATGLTIPEGKNQGTLLISAAEGAGTVIGYPKIRGRAVIGGTTVVRDSRLASLAWSVGDAKYEAIPQPRLMGDIVATITGEEGSPLTIAPAQTEVPVVQPDAKFKIPLKLTWRGEFSGALALRSAGHGFEKIKVADVPLNSTDLEVEVDLTQTKLPPGDHVFALYGGLVVKYRYNVPAMDAATEEVRLATEEIAALMAPSTPAAPAEGAEATATPAPTPEETAEKLKQAQARKAEAEKKLKAATDAAAPKELVDIVVSEPIRFRISPPETP